MTDNRAMSNPYVTNGYPPGYPPQNYRPPQPLPVLNLPPPQFGLSPPVVSPTYTTTYVAPVYASYNVPYATQNGTTTTYVTTYPAVTPYGLAPPTTTPYGLAPPAVTYQYAGYNSPTGTYTPNYTTPMYLQTYVQK